jgi:hypothetical protein
MIVLKNPSNVRNSIGMKDSNNITNQMTNDSLNTVLSKFHLELNKTQVKIQKEIEKSKAVRLQDIKVKIVKNKKDRISIKTVKEEENTNNDNIEILNKEELLNYKIKDNRLPIKHHSLAYAYQGQSLSKTVESLFKTGLPEIESNINKNRVTISKISNKNISSMTMNNFNQRRQISTDNIQKHLFNEMNDYDFNLNVQVSPPKNISTSNIPKVEINQVQILKSKPIGRKKHFKVVYIDNWFSKNGFPLQKLDNFTVNSLDFQSKFISDEIKVLMENMQRYKMIYLNDKKIFTIFKNLHKSYQIRFNKIIEDTCGLLMEISNDILIDFSRYLERFVSIHPPKPANFKSKIVINEEAAFISNVQVFNEVSMFFKACFEVYEILTKQVEDMVLPYQSFMRVHQFLARCRLNISNLTFSSKNFYKNFFHDQNLLDKFNYQIEKIDEESEDKESRRNDKIIRKDKSDLGEKLKRQYAFKVNEENDRIRRLNAVLNV